MNRKLEEKIEKGIATIEDSLEDLEFGKVEKSDDDLVRDLDEIEEEIKKVARDEEMDLMKARDDDEEWNPQDVDLEKPDDDSDDDNEERDRDEETSQTMADAEKAIRNMSSLEKAELTEAVEQIEHQGEMSRYGTLIKSAADSPFDFDQYTPFWLREVLNKGIDLNASEMDLGRNYEMMYHTNDPKEADDRARGNLESAENYYSSLLDEVRGVLKDIDLLAKRPTNFENPEVPEGYKFDYEYNCLVKVNPDEVKKLKEIDIKKTVETIERNFRKSLGLDKEEFAPDGRFTQTDIQKMVKGESIYSVLDVDEGGKEVDVETGEDKEFNCLTNTDGKDIRKAMLIAETMEEQARWNEKKK